MPNKPSYAELEQKVKELEDELEKKRAIEEQINISEEKYRTLFESNALIIFICDIKGHILLANPKAADFMNQTQASIIGKSFFDLRPDRKKLYHDVVNTILSKGETLQFETLYPTSKENKWLNVTVSPFKLGNELHLQIITQEITENKRTLEALKTSHANLTSLLENTDDFILISDHEAKPVIWNSTYEKIIKNSLNLDMKPGLQPHTFLPDKQAAAWWDNLHKRVLNGEKFRVEYIHDIGEGPARHLELSYNPIVHDGKITGFSEVTRDITERKKAEIDLEKRVEERTLELNRINNQLNTSLKEKEILLKELNHRVKNNLQILSGLIDLERQGSNPGETLRFKKAIKSKINAIALVHMQLHKANNLGDVNMGDYIRELYQKVYQLYATTAVNRDFKFQDLRLKYTLAVPFGLVLNEIFSNIFKHAFVEQNSGQVDIVLKKVDPDKARIRISDNGIGFPDHFDIDNASSMGMKLINGLIAEQLQGTFQIMKKDKKGTTLKIEFCIE